MKRVLIISPNFPPVNAPDMQRVRMSLIYYYKLGWEVEIICVDEKYVEGFRDELLCQTIPDNIVVHKVKAWSTKYTRKIGLGSLSIRSYFYFKKKGTELIKKKKFDLIFFSTTMFHVCALGKYWKQKFNIPFIIDLQDPWRNDFYLSKPINERPNKFWLSYKIHKYLEAYTIPYVSGIMAVSQGYIDEIKERYPLCKNWLSVVIPFGCSTNDFAFVKKNHLNSVIISNNPKQINVVYVGAITKNFLPIIKSFFLAFLNQIKHKENYRFYFIGTSYVTGSNTKLVQELAKELCIDELVEEEPNRISYFSAIATLQQANIIFIPGTADLNYNASKVYNCLLSNTPIFSIFNEKSLVKEVIEKSNGGIVIGINGSETDIELTKKIADKINWLEVEYLNKKNIDIGMFNEFTAEKMTAKQTSFFNRVLASNDNRIL
jgi:hypothetical protein